MSVINICNKKNNVFKLKVEVLYTLRDLIVVVFTMIELCKVTSSSMEFILRIIKFHATIARG